MRQVARGGCSPSIGYCLVVELRPPRGLDTRAGVLSLSLWWLWLGRWVHPLGMGAYHSGVEVGGKERLGMGPRGGGGVGRVCVPGEGRGGGAGPSMSLAKNLLLRRSESLGPGGWIRTGALAEQARGLIERFRVKAGRPQALAQSLSGGNLPKVIVGPQNAAQPKLRHVSTPHGGGEWGRARQRGVGVWGLCGRLTGREGWLGWPGVWREDMCRRRVRAGTLQVGWLLRGWFLECENRRSRWDACMGDAVRGRDGRGDWGDFGITNRRSPGSCLSFYKGSRFGSGDR